MTKESYEILPTSPAREVSRSASPDVESARRPNVARYLFATLAALACVLAALSFSSKRVQRRDTCPPVAFDTGRWVPKAGFPRAMNTLEEVYAAFNVTGCKAGFQSIFNLGLGDTKPPWHANDSQLGYAWQPHSSCQLPNISTQEKLQLLIDRPLFLNGDSRTRQHFFSLSCELNDHVRWEGATSPSQTTHEGSPVWRLEPQHLYLDADSPLMPRLTLPRGFDINLPIITYIMAYTPLSRSEMRELEGVDTSRIKDAPPITGHPMYEVTMSATLDVFTGPKSHYKTMVHSTGAHFGPTLLQNLTTSSYALAIMRAAVRVYYEQLSMRMHGQQRVLVRALTAGHTDHEAFLEPLEEVTNEGDFANFGYMPDLNSVLEAEAQLASLRDPRFKWIGTGRLSRLRPNAHMPGDGIHFTTGSGVLEAISRYMFYHLLLDS